MSIITAIFIAGLADAAATQSMENHIGKHDASHEAPDLSDESKLNVAVLLYDGALVLDYGVAAEMFLAADYMRAFNVFTVSETGNVRVSIFGETKTNFTFGDAPKADVIIVPGGPLWADAGTDADIIDYLKQQHDDGTILYSICTGALLLAQAGFLEDRDATTVHFAQHMMEAISPTTSFKASTFVDGGDIVTSAGSGTAMEATLAIVERLTNAEIAADLSTRYLNYNLVTD